MSSIWQMCDASCYGPVPCTDNSPCRDDQACLPSRDGTQTICRLCSCNEKDQCRTDTISGNVTCDCGDSTWSGPFCTCQPCQSSCPAGFTLFDKTCTCYAGFVDNPGEWETVKNRCHDMGASLVKITSDAENAFVLDLVRLIADEFGDYFWLGGNDIATEGTWIWDVDSTLITPVYTNWNLVAPDNYAGVQHCLEMFVNPGPHSGNGLWNDVPCDYGSNFICEYYP